MLEYNVIYPSGCDKWIYETAQRAAQTLGRIFGENRVKFSPETGVYTEAVRILIGDVKRPEVEIAKARWDVAEYGCETFGSVTVLGGWNQTTIALAVDQWCERLIASDSPEKCVTASFCERKQDWFTDIPAFPGAALVGSSDGGYGCLLLYYTGIARQAWSDYCVWLETSGYRLYFRNEIKDNLFATYIRENVMLHIQYTGYSRTVRIVTCKTCEELFSPEPEAYEKITDSAVVQTSPDYPAGNFGMGYVMVLEDGSFLVVDGGGAKGKDAERLWTLLNRLNRRPDGKIVIAAWLLTHEHWDHYSVFDAFCHSFGDRVTIECFICNTPAPSVCHDSFDPNYYMEEFFSSAAQAVGGIRLIRVHSGQIFYVRNAKVEILFCQDDLYPFRMDIFNNSSIVSKITLADTVFLLPGDICDVPSEMLCRMYGDYLKSDLVQVAHHGYNGATEEFYRLVKPRVAFWPVEGEKQIRQCAATGDKWFHKVNRYLCQESGVEKVLVADGRFHGLYLPYRPENCFVLEI